MRDEYPRVAAIAAATARERALIAAREGKKTSDPGAQLAALLDVARALTEASIPYALIGGIAVGIHSGLPRATDDIDLAVPTSFPKPNVIDVLAVAGFEATGEFEHSLNFKHPNDEPLQVVFDPGFDAMVERAEAVDVGGTTVQLVQKADLIAMKERAANDPARRKSKALRDKADVELLRGDVPERNEGW